MFFSKMLEAICNLPFRTRGFLMFSGGIERDQWHEMGQWKGKVVLKKSCSGTKMHRKLVKIHERYL